ncbi:MAG: DUF6745 domain-containing protein [Owenweeksia sp.]
MKISPHYLSEKFSFPHFLDVNHRQHRDAMTNIFFQLYELCGLEMPKVFYFKSPVALQQALQLISVHSYRIPDFSFYEEYAGFFKFLDHDERDLSPVNNRVWQWVSQRVAGEVSRFEMGGKDLWERIQNLNPFAVTLEEEINNDLDRRLSGVDLKRKRWAYHPHFRDRVWVDAQKPLLQFTDREKAQNFSLFADALEKGLMFAHLTSDMVLWCPLPQQLMLDSMGRLHNETGPSMQWEDDYALYHWHGIKVLRRLIEYPETISKADIIQEKNVEVRRCIQEKLGTERFASLFQLCLLDEDLDLKGNKQSLYRTAHIDDITGEYIQFARVSCPTSGRHYFLCVPPDITNVWEAVAWTFGKKPEEYQPAEET